MAIVTLQPDGAGYPNLSIRGRSEEEKKKY